MRVYHCAFSNTPNYSPNISKHEEKRMSLEVASLDDLSR